MQKFGEVSTFYRDQYQRLFLSAIEREVTLRASTESFKKETGVQPTFNYIYDDVIITIKGDIELEPSHKVLYYDLDNAFDIDIKRGSGEFSVSVNDSSIIKFSYDRANQRITVYPLAMGYAQIIVEDQKLISSQKAYCNIVVATGARIELTTDSSLIQEDDSTKMHVKVFSSDGDMFTQEQLRFMKIVLSLDTETEARANNIRISQVPNRYDQFSVKGLRKGEYDFSASGVIYKARNKYGEVQSHKLFSNRVELHVFEKLEARPPRLLLAPGCLAAVELVGGPSEKSRIINNVYIESRVTSERFIDIKTTDQSVYSVKAKNEGDTEIIFEVKYRDGRVIGSVVVKTKVAFVNGVEILGMLDRKIHVGTQIRLIALTRYDNEYFTHALCPFHFYWTSRHDSVLQIDSYPLPSIPCGDLDGESAAIDLTNYNIAVNATALSTGIADIELKVTTRYPDPYYRSYDYTTMAKVQVIEPMTHEIPTYIGKPPATPSVLLIPPNTDYQIRPYPHGGPYRYSLCPQKSLNGVYVTDTGYLSTSNEKGKTSVLVEDTQTDGEMMMLNIAITSIYSIFIENSYKVIKHYQFSYHKVLTLPLDSDSKLRIHIQDSLGRSFPSPAGIL